MGFSNNYINPDDAKNRMIQLWALPEEGGRPAGYKHYRPKAQGITRIYGGLATEGETFDSSTTIDILRLSEGECYDIPHESLSYVTEGELTFTEQDAPYKASDGSLVRGNNLILKAKTSCQVIVIRKAD
ncbi:MAG: hypothetical protein OXE99_09685 [Cellvibrionales bacterium]|nr:hypothetical protein [Cellvibrionales bacterium]